MSAIAGAIFATLAYSANADNMATCPEQAGFSIYSELKLEHSTVCISSNNDTAILSIITKSRSIKAENKSLIEASEIREEVVHLEQDGNKANLYFEYPNNVYLISIDASTGRLIESTQSLKTEALNNENTNPTLILKTKEKYIESAKISDIKKSYLFGKQQMEISSTTNLKITSPKTYLWNSPDDIKPTKMYLIKGDHIEANRYENGKLRIIYTTKSGKKIEKWIDISAVI